MPTLLRSGPYRIYFFSREPLERPHVHVDRDDCTAKLWIDLVSLARNIGFGARELRRIEAIVHDHRDEFLELWHAYFDD